MRGEGGGRRGIIERGEEKGVEYVSEECKRKVRNINEGG